MILKLIGIRLCSLWVARLTADLCFLACYIRIGTIQKQPDVIFSGSEFRKTIYPNDLVDFLYRQWRHYAMPEGDNGVYLSLKIKDNTVREKITVRMVKTPVN